MCGQPIFQAKQSLINIIFRDPSPSISMVHKCFTELRCGRRSTNDAERLGCPNLETTPEIIENIHDIKLIIADILGNSYECVSKILHEYLQIKKLNECEFSRRFVAVD